MSTVEVGQARAPSHCPFAPRDRNMSDVAHDASPLPSRTHTGDWLIRCPACSHVGTLPGHVPSAQRIRCSACGFTNQVRHLVGSRPNKKAKQRNLAVPSERAAREQRAREAIERMGSPSLDDGVADLFRRPPDN
jgi:ribosomal protein S27E